MSTLEVSNLNDGTTTLATTYMTNGSAKAWASLNGISFGLRDSFGISSATDVGTGNYTLNFSNAFGSTNYGVATVANNFTTFINATPTASAFNCGTRNSSNSDADSDFVVSAFHGDLA